MFKEIKGIGIGLAQNTIKENTSITTLAAVVSEIAARLGALQILDIHNLSPEALQTIYKFDGTPRTIADLQSGTAIRTVINRYFPNDTINEEETGSNQKENSRTWYVDPLDGTGSYARRQKYSTVGISAYENGQPAVATIINPFEKEMIIAESGKGAWLFQLNEKLRIDKPPTRVRVSDNNTLKGGMAYIDALFNPRTTPHKLDLIRNLTNHFGDLNIRMTGSNIDQQRQVASGRAEITIIDAVGGFYDFAGNLIITESGGNFTDMYGEPVNDNTQVAVGSNGKFHDQILEIVRNSYQGYQGFR